MTHIIDSILDAALLAAARATLSQAPFEDGRTSAGWAARTVKDNTQAAHGPALEPLCEHIRDALLAHPVFALAARPKLLIGPQFSRTAAGQSYGTHTDEPVMAGMRIDLAFTVFLTDPAAYDGGALILETNAGEDAYKLTAGSAIVYPATCLHRVEPVTSGARLAAFGWVRSHVRHTAQRELLFDLDTARLRLFESHGKTRDFDLLSQCSANLMRMWCCD
jgi:PKHD-type hydroxylase